MRKTEFMNIVQEKRKSSFPTAFDLAYDSFCTLGLDKKDKSFFLASASECIEKLRAECWREFLKSEDAFTKRVLKDESLKMDYTGLTPQGAVCHFIDEKTYDIYDLCLSNTQSRRSRAGKEFEAIIEMLLIGCDIPYTSQGNIGKNFFTKKGLGKMVDEVIPGATQEMARTGAKEMYLATLDEKITPPVLKSLAEENIIITTTRAIKEKFYAKAVEVITFEELLTACENLGTYWEAYDFSDEEKTEIIKTYERQYEENKAEKPYVAAYAKRMIEKIEK